MLTPTVVHRVVLSSLLLALFWTGSGATQSTSLVPTPLEFFGFEMGTPRRLADWTQIVEYFHAVGQNSPRVTVQELGKTTMGRPYLLAVVSAPDTIADLETHRAMQHRLADPRLTSETEADRIAHEGKVVVLVGTNVHGTEIGNSQMVNELLHQLATEQSRWMDHVLDRVILLLVPSQNPDGQQMVVDWYRKNLGSRYEGSPLPVLYHKYAGHDNNRDSYMLTQVETQLLAKLTYEDWLPEVYLDKHQMGNSGARIFVPPFTDPPNPNIDPLVWSQVNMLGQAMAASLHRAGKPGVVWGELYTGFWQGANSTNPWWHNMVGLLTEVASADLATTVTQDHADPADRARRGSSQRARRTSVDAGLAIAAPSDLRARMNYLQPWTGGSWSLRDVVDYQLISTRGLLEGAANNSATLKRNFYEMNRRTIERFTRGDPYAFVIPPGQRDPVAAARLVQLLQAEGAEVHRADAPFRAGGAAYLPGSYVVRLAQPFGRWVKDILEPQRYPNDGAPPAGRGTARPYDVTAWTLGILMGVEVVQVDRPFEAQLTMLAQPAEPPPGRVSGRGAVYVLDHAVNRSFVAMNRLLREGADIAWASDALVVNDRPYGPGAMLIRGVSRETMTQLARDLALRIDATDDIDGPALPIVAPRVGVYEPWGGNMDAGWTRWLLEQHEFPFMHVRNQDLRAGSLRNRFDVIIIPEITTSRLLRGLRASNVRPEYKGGIGEVGANHLREFVRGGGTLVTLGNAARFAISTLQLPIRDVVQGLDEKAFFCPGSLLTIAVDDTHPIGFGMPATAAAMFVNNGGYVVERGAPNAVEVVASYPSEPLVRSGSIVGDRHLRGTGAVLDVSMGQGRVIMQTFRVQHRGQTWGTFRLLFNSIVYGAAMAANPMVETLEAAEVQP